MGEKPDVSGSLVTLPVVLGVIVVIGGISALAVSGLFVYRAHRVKVETAEMQASLQAERDRVAHDSQPPQSALADNASAGAPPSAALPPSTSDILTSALDPAVKPGARLHAQRPAHWDEAEVIDVLADNRVKVRWLSGAPGEDVIASESVRGEGEPPTN